MRWVYELNDTEGKPVPEHTTDPFVVLGKPPGASWSRTVELADRYGIRVELTGRWGNRRAGIAGVLHSTEDGASFEPVQRFNAH